MYPRTDMPPESVKDVEVDPGTVSDKGFWLTGTGSPTGSADNDAGLPSASAE
jgi:hypothetical protein